jgi:hypothetical protein
MDIKQKTEVRQSMFLLAMRALDRFSSTFVPHDTAASLFHEQQKLLHDRISRTYDSSVGIYFLNKKAILCFDELGLPV